MKRFLSMLLVVSLTINVFVYNTSYAIADDNEYNFNGHTYKFFDTKMTWNQAKETCEKMGGHLATFTSQEEWMFIYKYICDNEKQYWLGGNDADNEGEWMWITGENWNYSDWCSNEPNNDYGGTEDYLGTYTSTYQWNDYRDIEQLGFICEWDNGSIEAMTLPSINSDDTERLVATNSDFEKLEDMLEELYFIHDEEFDSSTTKFENVFCPFITQGYGSWGYEYFFGEDGEELYYTYNGTTAKPDPKDRLYFEYNDIKDYYYYKLDADNVDWISRNIYNVEPDHSMDIGGDMGMYYYNGYYYIKSGDAGYIGHSADITDYKVLSDGKYYVTVYYNVGEGYEQNYNYMVVDLKNIDGKNQWSFYKNSISPFEYEVEKEIVVILNGETLSFDQAPYIENDVTMVPMRAIFEALGAKIYYDADTDTITAFRNDKTIKHTIGDEYIDVNGVWELTLAPSKIVNDTTMIPIRVVSEGFGADVTWDSETRTINITYDNDLEIKSNILDEYRLLAITCANSYSYDYMKNDFENPSSVIIDNANIKSSEVYQGINDFIDFFELKYSPTNYYEVALMDMLYNKNDYYENAKEIMDNDLVKEIYSQFNKKLRENQNANKVTISGLNVFDVDKFYNDLTILDSILVAKDSADAMYDKFMQLYTLSQISDEKIKALEIIATNTTNQDIKTACDNVILAIREANQQTIEEMAANGAFAGMEELANFVVDRGWKELTNLIPGMIEARTIVSAGKLVSNNLYNADEISNDLLTMAALKEINETVKTAMINHENAFLLNSTGINAVDYIAISKFYMDINKYGCDVVLEFVDDVKYAKNVQNVFDKIKYFFPLLAPFSNINDLLNNYNEENVNALKESVTNIRSMLNSDNYDFFKTYVEFE